MGPMARRVAGLSFVPEERNGHAAVPEMRLSENALLTSYEREGAVQMGVVSQAYATQSADRISEMFDVRRPEADPLASALSGGNLQKFVVGREIAKKPDVLIVSQPTWGGCWRGSIYPKGDDGSGCKRGSCDYCLSRFGRDFLYRIKLQYYMKGGYHLPMPPKR